MPDDIESTIAAWEAKGLVAPGTARKPRAKRSMGNPIHPGPAGWAAEFVVPWRPVNESNVHDGVPAKIGRKKKAKAAAAAALPPLLPPPPVRVTLTRLGGQQRMDDDGLARAMKPVRDVIAAALGCDDGDRAKVVWKYRQRPAYGASRVLIRVETREG
jgi:hypothetical protein